MQYKLLQKVNSPADVKKLEFTELNPLCDEIRDFLVNSVAKTGGHLASNLGTVELTVALHRVFNSPDDKLIFDVGHQSYTHKILTGRKERFSTLRQKDGLSGFPKPWESEHDAFISGHSSTSVSAAYGIAKAMAMQGEKHHAVAVIGDGSFTGGQAYEAINNAGRSNTRLIIVLNHNDMSISKNVGAFARYLTTIRVKPGYLKLKTKLQNRLDHTPLIGKQLRKWLHSSRSFLKSIIYHTTFFENLGFQFIGPVDGHNVGDLMHSLTRARDMNRPVVVQVETIKGKGYALAEDNPGAYHATGGFDPQKGSECNEIPLSYSEAMGLCLQKLGGEDSRICAITAAMKYGTGLQHFYQSYRERFFDVGIAEAHAVTFAGGLASRGLIPVFAVYSSFLQRGYDQIIHDLAIDCRHVVLCVDRAGIVGEDGETHQGVFDVAYLSQVPDITIYSPEGYSELCLCLKKAVMQDSGVVAVRYPRGGESRAHSIAPNDGFYFEDNKGKTLVISYGRMFSNCYAAAKKVDSNVSLLKITRLAPLERKIAELASGFKNVIFVEEAIKRGGIAEQLGAMLLEANTVGGYHIRAIDGVFVPQSTVGEAFLELKMDVDSIAQMIEDTERGS